MSPTPGISQGLRISERQFTQQVGDMAKLMGWLRYHTWLAKHSPAGFPDEVLVRPPRLVFAELKSEDGTLSASQETWLTELAATGAEVYVWRPSMLDGIAECLRRGSRPLASEIPGAWRAAA